MMIGVITLRNGPQPGRNHRQSTTSISLSLFFLTAISLTSPTDKQEKEEKPRVLKTPQDKENGETVQRRRARDCTRNEAAATIKREAERTNRGSPTDGRVANSSRPGQYIMGLWGRKIGLKKDKNIGKNEL
ncbi:hypothetical protein M9H77_21043 [Catharanthus roseus]|uniref:Uncharacterized protein n=1 Tax=Catharanthus roseus TaxID=4058 RepID=A0ACC0ALF4_CATRO|nr:hypothetical protein M9H77_21043 [Catharanthus roseus]